MRKSGFVLMFAAGIILALFCSPVAAFEPIPNESGFDGFVRLGGGYSWVKSNMIAGNDLGDVGQRKIDSIKDSPDSKSDGIPQFDWNVKYTFAGTRTQLFAGSRLEDIFRFDATTQAGVRQEFKSLGIVGASFVFTTLPTEVWKDPYVENDGRKKTDRTSRGIRLAWERMFNSNFEVDYIYRNIDIDKERSGDFLVDAGRLAASDKDKLKRKGDAHQLKGAYFFEIGKNQLLSPQLIFDYEDLDGDAMKNYKTDFQLTYAYNGPKFALGLNGLIGYADYDKKNPIYGKTRDDTRYGAGALGSWKNPFGWKPFGIDKFRLYSQVGYFVSDSNIDFYETEIFLATAGIWIGF
ncbi:MAG: DUF2860 family protein [Deltaproteobacteria bacterium]|nr:DUF2860 family protein [Deltaproteobacteria bacterium]